jgi:tellurite resistance protein TerC
LDGLLSIDNAAVLGAMVVHLPDDVPITWPHALKGIGDRMHHLLGNQRTAALRVGLLGAYLGRGIMLFLATIIVQNPWLKVIGALYLIRLAFDNLGKSQDEDEDASINPIKVRGFWSVVLTVELADLAFSLDNVVAAVSLSDLLWVILLGVAIGILFMRFAAGLFSYAVEREPILKNAAYILVFNIAVELLLEELGGIEISDWVRFGVSISTILGALAYANIKFLRVTRPFFIWIARGFAALNEVMDWALEPFFAFVNLIVHAIKLAFRKRPAVE